MGGIKLNDEKDKIFVARKVAIEVLKRLSSGQLNDLGEFLTTLPEAQHQGKDNNYENLLAAINAVNGVGILNVDVYLRSRFPPIYEQARDFLLPTSEEIMGPFRRGELTKRPVKEEKYDDRRFY